MAVTHLAVDPAFEPSEGDLPVVSVAVPMLNESGFIIACLDSFAAQDYPLGLLDVIVIDGGSEDGCRSAVEAYAATRNWIRVVDNPAGSAATAFNIGTKEAYGDVVILFSSHGVADFDFVLKSVAALKRSDAAGVGGSYRHEGLDRTSSAIGLAMVSPVGMASPHRFATKQCDVDTISHPAYWRDAMLEIDGFDESLKRNSDYEFNHRLRAAGHRLHFDPTIGSVYRPRPGLDALFRQFWYYGRWKAEVVARHPASLRPRHLAAPVAVAGVALSPFLMRLSRLRPVIGVSWAAYVAIVGYGVVRARPRTHEASVATTAAAFPVMHAAWGAGFITSALSRISKRWRR